jgi:hypothetical protein
VAAKSGGLTDLALSQAELLQLTHDFVEQTKPPIKEPADIPEAKQRLLNLSLLAPVQFADDEKIKFIVHRWTAAALARLAAEVEQRDAHRTAVDYWRWRVLNLSQPPQFAVSDLLEARHHLLASGDLAQFCEVSEIIFTRLETWGAWEWEERLIRETLALTPEGSREAAACLIGTKNRWRLHGSWTIPPA